MEPVRAGLRAHPGGVCMTGSYWDETWNVVIGCDRVSAGCDGCFAIPTGAIRQANPHPAVAAAFAGTVARRHGKLDWAGRVNMLTERLTMPLRWKKPRRIYVTLLGDLFHEQVTDEFIARVFAVMARTPQHTYILTTKRHARMRSLIAGEDGSGHRLLQAATDVLLDRDTFARRVGVKEAGRVLDGRTWDELPTAIDEGGTAHV
jgi:protein gp37